MLTREVLARYKKCLNYFLDTKLEGNDYKTILDVVLFLNYPQWRQENTLLISKCLLFIKNDLDSLNVNELVTLYEVNIISYGCMHKILIICKI